jgi:hypothetical protein
MNSVHSSIAASQAGFELSKNKWGGGVDICLFIVTVITHRQFSIINNGGGGLKLTPRGIPGHLVWGGGVEQTTGGGSTPPTPPAIQTLIAGPSQPRTRIARASQSQLEINLKTQRTEPSLPFFFCQTQHRPNWLI